MKRSDYQAIETIDDGGEQALAESRVVNPTPSAPLVGMSREEVVSISSAERSDRDLGNNSSLSQRERRWAILLFSITTIILFADQNLMAPNLTAIAEDFGLTDEQRDTLLAGDVSLAFWLLGVPAGLVVGCLTDRYNRPILFALSVGIGEFACFLTYWANSFLYLFICRAITGLGIGGAIPVIYSFLGDVYATDARYSVNAYVGMGTGIGTAVGQGIAGFLGPIYGWRLPFLLVSVPAIVCALLVFLTVKDPERGAMEEVIMQHQQETDDASTLSNSKNGNNIESGGSTLLSGTKVPGLDSNDPLPSLAAGPTQQDVTQLNIATAGETKESSLYEIFGSSLDSFSFLMSTPTVVLAILQAAPGCIPWGIVNTYLNDFLAQNRGFSVELATLVVMFFGIGNFLGLLLGGYSGQYLYRMDKRYPALLAGSTCILGCFPFLILLDDIYGSTSYLITIPVGVIAGVLTGITGPIIAATLCNTTLPNMRGQAFALFNTFNDFGRGLGPIFVSIMIVNCGGRTVAFNYGTSGWLLCGVANLLVFFTAEQDEKKCQDILSANLS